MHIFCNGIVTGSIVSSEEIPYPELKQLINQACLYNNTDHTICYYLYYSIRLMMHSQMLSFWKYA